jgi:hypothetical protein
VYFTLYSFYGLEQFLILKKYLQHGGSWTSPDAYSTTPPEHQQRMPQPMQQRNVARSFNQSFAFRPVNGHPQHFRTQHMQGVGQPAALASSPAAFHPPQNGFGATMHPSASLGNLNNAYSSTSTSGNVYTDVFNPFVICDHIYIHLRQANKISIVNQ